MAYNSLRLEHEEMKANMAALRKGQDGIQVNTVRRAGGQGGSGAAGAGHGRAAGWGRVG